jgi:flagellar brake protein
MPKDIPLTIDRLSEEQERECRITSARQIQSLLHHISEQGLRAVLYFDGGRDFIITSLLEVNDAGFWVEQSSDPKKNLRIAKTQKITLVSSLDQVKIQFSGAGLSVETYQGYPAFYLPLPGILYRVQRRENYRLVLPLAERLHCVIQTNKPNVGDKIDVPVMDISGGGLRLFADGEFVLGQNYGGCHIKLPEMGEISFTMTVKNLVTISPKPGLTVKRVGCEFDHLDNASSILLQRYVTRMQRFKSE